MTDPGRHLTDDDLVLLFYGEGPERTHAAARAHIDDCQVCRDTWHRLTRTMHLASAADVPDPGRDFESRMWTRIEPRIRPARHRTVVRWAALAASLVVIVGAFWYWAHGSGESRQPTTTSTFVTAPALQDGFREHVLLSAVDAHLMQTELLFVEVLNSPADHLDSADYRRAVAGDLLASGRLYRETAEETGHLMLTGVLDAIEPVLVELAHTDEDGGALQTLQGRIEQNDLLFKVRAVATDVQDRQGRFEAGRGES